MVSEFEIVRFVEARLGEEESIARRFNGERWEVFRIPAEPGEYCLRGNGSDERLMVHLPAPMLDYLTHFATHDPAHVLREVAAKRLLIDEAFGSASNIDSEWGDGHSPEQIRAGECSDHGYEAAMRVLRILAVPYVEHPDYMPEWAELNWRPGS